MRKATFLVTSIAILSATTVAAAPIARKAPLSSIGREMPSSQQQHIPSSAAVPFPAYPGSYFYQMEPNDHPRKGMRVQLTLVSNDGPKTVKAWYAKELKGMKYSERVKAFVPRGFKGNFPALLRTSHIMIRATTPHKLSPSLYVFPHAKTEIMLDYAAK